MGRGPKGALRGREEPGFLGTGRQLPMFANACIHEHLVNIVFPESRGRRFRNRPALRPVYDLILNRQLSLSVSMISQSCAGQSSKAAVIFPPPNTLDHSPKGRFVVTATDVRSQACETPRRSTRWTDGRWPAR